MRNRQTIKNHQMEDWFSGVYIKPFSLPVSRPNYDNTLAHRHDFYYFVVSQTGQLQLEVDFENIIIQDNTAFLSYPGQVHRIISAEVRLGWFIAFDPALMDQHLKDILDQCISQSVLLALTPSQLKNLNEIAGQVFSIYNDLKNPYRQVIIQALVTVFIYQYAGAHHTIDLPESERHPPRSIELTTKFKQLLRLNFKTLKKPSQYAEMMAITLNHLNDTVKMITGSSITIHIQEQIMLEAKPLLYHTDLPIKEIANMLGYDDALYFSRLFRKVTNLAPGSFRKNK